MLDPASSFFTSRSHTWDMIRGENPAIYDKEKFIELQNWKPHLYILLILKPCLDLLEHHGHLQAPPCDPLAGAGEAEDPGQLCQDDQGWTSDCQGGHLDVDRGEEPVAEPEEEKQGKINKKEPSKSILETVQNRNKVIDKAQKLLSILCSQNIRCKVLKAEICVVEVKLIDHK